MSVLNQAYVRSFSADSIATNVLKVNGSPYQPSATAGSDDGYPIWDLTMDVFSTLNIGNDAISDPVSIIPTMGASVDARTVYYSQEEFSVLFKSLPLNTTVGHVIPRLLARSLKIQNRLSPDVSLVEFVPGFSARFAMTMPQSSQYEGVTAEEQENIDCVKVISYTTLVHANLAYSGQVEVEEVEEFEEVGEPGAQNLPLDVVATLSDTGELPFTTLITSVSVPLSMIENQSIRTSMVFKLTYVDLFAPGRSLTVVHSIASSFVDPL